MSVGLRELPISGDDARGEGLFERHARCDVWPRYEQLTKLQVFVLLFEAVLKTWQVPKEVCLFSPMVTGVWEKKLHI